MGGPVFEGNEGGGRWGHNRGVMGEQAGRDDTSKVGVSRQGVHIPLSCTTCSMVFVSDEKEAVEMGKIDPDDLRAESVVIPWNEVKGMVSGQLNTIRLQKTTTGYTLVEVCPRCSQHYEKRGMGIDPRGLPKAQAREAMIRRRSVSASRHLPISSILRWLETGRRAGVVV